MNALMMKVLTKLQEYMVNVKMEKVSTQQPNYVNYATIKMAKELILK